MERRVWPVGDQPEACHHEKESISPPLSETMATAVGRTLFLRKFVNVRLVTENTDHLDGSKNR